MQWLVYVHNHPDAGSDREAGAVLADAPTAPDHEEGSFARVWVDRLAPDTAAEIRKVVTQLFADYPPIEGMSSSHMTEMANAEVMTGPGFEDAATVVQALLEALGDAEAKVA